MSKNNFDNMNPMYGVYNEIEKIIKSVIIKYNYIVEQNESFESSRNADGYLAIINNRDTYDSYQYTEEDFRNASIDESVIYQYFINGDDSYLTNSMKESIFNIKRRNVLLSYEEQNEYYRLLNGLPRLDTNPSDYYTIDFIQANIINKNLTTRFNIDGSIPIHKIQDYYNNIEPTRGDFIITNIEGLGVIDEIIKYSTTNDARKNKDERYLNHIGSRRVPIEYARQAKNFQILYV